MAEHPQDFADRQAAAANEWAGQNVADGGVCDFCCHLLADRPVSPGKPEAGSGLTVIVQDEFWARCPDCDPVVGEGDAARRAAHVLEYADFERIGVPRERLDVAGLQELYERFYARNPVRSTDAPKGIA